MGHFQKTRHRAKSKRFSTLKRTQNRRHPTEVECRLFVVQYCLTVADFAISSNYCLIGTRVKPCRFSCGRRWFCFAMENPNPAGMGSIYFSELDLYAWRPVLNQYNKSISNNRWLQSSRLFSISSSPENYAVHKPRGIVSAKGAYQDFFFKIKWFLWKSINPSLRILDSSRESPLRSTER